MPETVLDTDQLDDFDLTGITDGQILKWNATNQRFEPANDATISTDLRFRKNFLLMGA